MKSGGGGGGGTSCCGGDNLKLIVNKDGGYEISSGFHKLFTVGFPRWFFLSLSNILKYLPTEGKSMFSLCVVDAYDISADVTQICIK